MQSYKKLVSAGGWEAPSVFAGEAWGVEEQHKNGTGKEPAHTQTPYHTKWEKSVSYKERKAQLDTEKCSFIIQGAVFISWEKVHIQPPNIFFK